MQTYCDANPELAVTRQYVWVPQFPRELEVEALPEMAARYTPSGAAQYWDGDRRLGRLFLDRIVPEFLGGDAVWDTFVLFGPDATWGNAQDHIIAWDYTVEGHTKELFAALQHLRAE